MRIFLASTTTGLRELLEAGSVGPAPITGFAVTPGLREWYTDGDLESLEYAALHEAARGSLRLLDADSSAVRRRVVLAAEITEDLVEIRDDLDRGVVSVVSPVPMAAIVSVYVDDAEAEETVALAAEAVIAADFGEVGSSERVDDTDGFELSWYANQEIGALLELM